MRFIRLIGIDLINLRFLIVLVIWGISLYWGLIYRGQFYSMHFTVTLTVLKDIVCYTGDCVIKGSSYGGYTGCLPFTTTFRKFRLESKWYTTFRVVPVEKIREQRNV